MLKFDIFGICLIWFFLFSLLKYNFFCRSEASSTGCRLCLPSFLSLGLRSLPFPVMGTLLRLVYASSKLSSPRSVSSASFVIDRCLFSSPLKYECVLWRYYFSFFFFANIFLAWACVQRCCLAQWRFLSAADTATATALGNRQYRSCRRCFVFVLPLTLLSLPQNVVRIAPDTCCPIPDPPTQRQPPQTSREYLIAVL